MKTENDYRDGDADGDVTLFSGYILTPSPAGWGKRDDSG